MQTISLVLGMLLVAPVSAAGQRFGPPDQPYYYKKTDDVQADDPEVSLQRKSASTKGSRICEQTCTEKTSTHKRMLSKH
ncbi:hypothetical protein CRENBAI_010447 [Crenichthys baileyi]|uniref:Secreted protein n=1 Tax=Crenichthys baileyi TaxID=28760 RepID=A0AAV9S0X6_9TELE